MEHNPFLSPAAPAARGSVEKPQNIPWQTRAAPPGEYDNRLGDALIEIFGRGIDALAEVVKALNQAGVPDPAGQPWTEGSFEEHLKTLGR
jgi:hypothetical protein